MKFFTFLLPFSLSAPDRTETIAWNIFEMAQAILDGSGAYGFTVNDGVNYGCAGRGSYSAFTGSIGKPVDDTDKAFNSWKKCVKCAAGDSTDIPYQYNVVDDSCGDSSSESRAICECDRVLVNFLYNASTKNSNYKTSKCKQGKRNILHSHSSFIKVSTAETRRRLTLLAATGTHLCTRSITPRQNVVTPTSA